MQTPRDENRIPVLMGVLDVDGKTPIAVCSDQATAHYMCVSDGVDGTDFGYKSASRDENRVPTAMAVSSADGKTLVPLYVNSDNELLIQTT